MKAEEANRIIAEYMDELFNFKHNLDWIPYTESLVALVPVWEKLELFCTFDICKILTEERWQFHLRNFTGTRNIRTFGKTIQEAAATATALCIKELNNE